MKNTGKALFAIALLGTTVGCVVLGLLYNSCLNSHSTYTPKLEEAKKQLKDLEDKLAAKEDELTKANADLKKYENTSVDLAPCQYVESNFDYKTQYETAISQLQDVEGQLEDTKEELEEAKLIVKKTDDELRQEVMTLQQNYHEQVKHTNDWKDKYAESQQKVSELQTQLEREKQISLTHQQHQLKMMADMSDQYSKEKTQWESEKADLVSKVTDTVNYYLNRQENCDWHYDSPNKRYGKVCYDNGGQVKREIWMAGEENSETAVILKQQFDLAPEDHRFIDGQKPIKK